MKLFRHNTFERKLFGWLLSLALVPTLTMLVAAVWIWSGSLNWVGTLGAWDQLADSGRALFEAAEPYGVEHPPLAQAVARHRRDLSESVTMARRWTYLGQRLTAQLPVFVLGLSAGLGALALLLSRRLARELAQPLENLVDWAQRLGREEPLPPPGKLDAAGTVEVQALRRALRQASRDLELARRRALEMERLRVWGEMARRVAHEMKNPLTPLRLAAHRLARDGAAAEPLAVIQEEAGRLEELAAQFAALGRPVAGPASEIDLPELLRSLLASDVPRDIEVSCEAQGELPPVHGHYDALLRAFRNILRNAVEAMESVPGPHRLSVTIGTEDRAGSPIHSMGGAVDWLRVTVADTGPGIPEALGDRIFEPDCTTKSSGTGLGLALVRQAVAVHGGEVTAHNSAEGGAVFTVRLPGMVAAHVPQVAG